MNNDNYEIKVSILCAVYNHERYLRECLDGFVKQKTNFKFEILVHDDFSTDNSKHIIEEYYKKYPDIIVPIYEEENQYSKGRKINIDILMPLMKGKYFAFCEGDDYWIDEKKLQKQYEFMEMHPGYSLCVHNAIVVNTEGKIIRRIDTVEDNKNITCDEFILGGGGFISTNSIFAPSKLVKKLPDYFNTLTLDYVWQIYLSSQGKVYCFKEYMSAYRAGVSNSWTQKMSKESNRYIEHIKRINKMLLQFDDYTKKKYTKSVNEKIVKNEIDIANIIGNYKILKTEPYKSIIKTYPFKDKIKLFIKAYLLK